MVAYQATKLAPITGPRNQFDAANQSVRPALQPVTLDVEHASDAKRAEAGAMFNGWPATHADILAGLTFERTISRAVTDYLNSENALIAIIIGASGVGKTTAARQVLQRLRQDGTLVGSTRTTCLYSPTNG